MGSGLRRFCRSTGRDWEDRGNEWGAGAFPVAQSFALPCLSQISAFCALAARSPCICSHLRVALRFAQQPTGLTLPSGALRVALGLRPKCPQGTRFPSRLPGFGAEPQSLMPQHFLRALRAPERRKKRGSPQKQGFFNGLRGDAYASPPSRFICGPEWLRRCRPRPRPWPGRSGRR